MNVMNFQNILVLLDIDAFFPKCENISVHKGTFFKNTTETEGVSWLVDITAGGDFLGLCDQKSLYKHVSDFGRLRSYGHFLIPVHALV